MTHTIYKRRLGSAGKKTTLFSPLKLDSVSSVFLGDYVFINHNAWIMGNPNEDCTLKIDDHTVIGHFSHIIAHKNVHIGRNVLMADKVFISDCTHGYEDIDTPIIRQPV